VLPSRDFIELTQPEIAAQLKANPLVILPASSVEQHGPHLPTGTDIYAARVIAHAVAERMDGLVLPGGPLGVTPLCHHHPPSIVRSSPTPP
jgi:creatinine amidohydrolase